MHGVVAPDLPPAVPSMKRQLVPWMAFPVPLVLEAEGHLAAAAAVDLLDDVAGLIVAALSGDLLVIDVREVHP